ncbi:ferredoxin [Streptomyces sp. C1-2]|uniref:ferredoxin n=1 Tax=Streptomyces TaxID=1883 RepID=UPI0014327869|nr:ferredoxin [Streptomyces sp. C1-2]
MSAVLRGADGTRLSVDHGLCSGTGHCQEAAPGAFRLVDRRAWPAEGLDLAAADHAGLRRAADACPWYAITFTPGGNG